METIANNAHHRASCLIRAQLKEAQEMKGVGYDVIRLAMAAAELQRAEALVTLAVAAGELNERLRNFDAVVRLK